MTSVAERSAESAAMMAAAAKGRALMGGTREMRGHGETYLPKFKAEDREQYNARLSQSWLFNGYKKTAKDMTGRVFDKPVELGDGAGQIEEWAMNIDMQGRDLSTFAHDVFYDAISGAGISFVMVDAPRRDGEKTKAQAEAENLRPYLTHLRVEDVLGWRSEVVNNKQTLTMIRIYETITQISEEDEFVEEEIEQVRVLDLFEGTVRVRLFRHADNGWTIYEEYFTGQTEIMVAPFYANRTGFFRAEPPLEDLADINIAHWQSQSDQRNILHFARVPILVRAGVTQDTSAIAIGAAHSIDLDDPQAKVFWAEHSGQAIGAGRQDLKDLEFQMETFGLQLLVSRTQSATGEALDAKKETSQLAMIADSLKDTLEQAIAWMGVLGGVDASGATVEVNKDFGVSMMTAQEITALLSAVNTGRMSNELFLREMIRRGVVASDTSVEDELERIEDDQDDLMTGGVDGFSE